MEGPRIRDPDWIDHALKAAEQDSDEAYREHERLVTTPSARSVVALNLAIRSHLEARIALQGIHTLAKAIASLEASGAVDGAIVDTLTEMAERMDLIEQRGFRYLGRYQAANEFKRGDVVTHRDQLWCCVLEAKVGERPNTHCHKWTLMLNGKGADL